MTKYYEPASNSLAKIYLDNLLLRIPGSIYWKDKDGVYLGCNYFQAKMAGFDSPLDMIGKTDYDLPWHDMAADLKETDGRIMQTGKSEELYESPFLQDGTQLVMLTNKSPLYDEQGNIIGIVGISLDVTALKKTEEREKIAREEAITSQEKAKLEEELRRALMVLAGSIAHDLRTPLSCLRTDNRMLESCVPILLEYYHAAQKAGLDFGIKPTEKFTQWIEELPSISKDIERFIAEMHSFIDVNLKSIKYSTSNSLRGEDLVACKSYKEIDNALDSYPFQGEDRSLIKWDRTYYFNFLGNPILFMRIIFNLLGNALYQIYKNGKGQIFIVSEEHPEANIIRFKDTAGGAPPEVVDHIFDGYKTTKEEGTGVGLAFCKLMMKSFGGDITCHSLEGDFIEFVLTFPKIEDLSKEA